jgi:predicted O-methyltransferase YrrM
MQHYYESVDGWMWFKRCYEKLLASLPDDRVSHFVELGCFRGRSLAWLGVEVINARKPVTIHAVDNWLNPEVRADFDRNIAPVRAKLGKRFRIYPSDSAQAAALFADKSVDVVFVDADHSYEACGRDIDAWWPKVKFAGYLAGDDFAYPGVQQAVDERFAGSYELIPGSGPDSGPYPSWLMQKT